MDKLKQIVDDYITFIKSDDFHEDNDFKNYIYEAAVEHFYGKDIWKCINARMSGKPWPAPEGENG